MGCGKEAVKGGLGSSKKPCPICGSGGSNYFSDLVAKAKAELVATPTRETLSAMARKRR